MKKHPLPDLEVLDWGRVDYGKALSRQKALVEERIAGSSADRLVLVEHSPVVTLGRSGSLRDLRISDEALRQKGVGFHYTDRGGMATFHGPGQMVAYPILKLENKDLHPYVKALQNTVASLLRDYDLEAEFRDGSPGVWVNSAKVASIGLAVRRGVTYHGVALNVNVDPEGFRWIIPCGQANQAITSMEKELGYPLDGSEVKDRFVRAFCRTLHYVELSPLFRRSPGYPAWLIRPPSETGAVYRMEERLRQWALATVCETARCPNLGECFARNTATFMILGTRCTRRCRFCAVDKGSPLPVDPEEPERVAAAANALKFKHVVVTSVTRDDLADGGAGQFARTIRRVRERCPDARVEVLVPDFGGSLASLGEVLDARPDVFNHNLETVARLYPAVRPQARYLRSLGVIEYAGRTGLRVKSGLMLGLGEAGREVMEALKELKRRGCHDLTLGQYMAPSGKHIPVARYVPPEEFERWAERARSMGFKGVLAGPLVRSSYRAHEMFEGAGRPLAR